MGSQVVLVFPANVTEALIYARQRHSLHQPVIGASLRPDDPALAGCYDRVLALPHLSDPDFAPALFQVVSSEGVQRLVTSQTVVWGHLRSLCAEMDIELELISTLQRRHLLAFCQERATELDNGLWPPSLRPEAPAPELLLSRALGIPGHSGHEKLLDLMRVMARAVPGDIVEIGVLWGRSAWLLAALSRLWGLGRFLGVDPWPREGFVQHSPVLDAQSGTARDFETVYQSFCSVLWPEYVGHANLLRLSSLEAAEHYGSGVPVSHSLLGETAYAGRISVLHIDGSHAYEDVVADLEAWSPFLAPGAWVVLDDYRWGFGDGPRLAGDAFVASRSAKLEQVFEHENSLYIRFA